jgi:hypothetical protein
MTGRCVREKTMGITGYGKGSSRVRKTRGLKSTTTGPTIGHGVMGFDQLVCCVYLGCACILAVLGAIILAISMVLLQRSAIFERASRSAPPLGHHYRQPKRESMGSREATHGDLGLWGHQSIWGHATRVLLSIWQLRLGVGQMICGRREETTHGGKVGKRRLMRQPRTWVSSSHHRHHHHRRPRMNASGEVGGQSTETAAVATTTTTIHSYVGIMPRPGEAGMAVFDGKGVSTFLKDWEMDCDEYGLTEIQKCKKFPRYCMKDIGEAVEKLNGYAEGNWELLQKELKQLFWQDDPPKNSIAALIKLIGEAKSGKMTVDMYVLKYTAMTQDLVKKSAMSTFDRNVWLLEGLSEVIQSKVFEYCSDRKWRMLEHDVNMEEPRFEDLRDVVLAKARTMERKNLFLSGRLSGMGYLSTEATITPTASTVPSPTPTTMTSPNSTASDLDLKDLTEQISRLTLLINGQSQPAPPQLPWNARCMYCDSLVHTRRNECPEFQEALGKGVIGINEMGRVKLMLTGEELPLMFGKGGMRVVVANRLATLTGLGRVPTQGVGVAAVKIGDELGPLYGASGKSLEEEFMGPWEARCNMVVVGKGQGGHQ